MLPDSIGFATNFTFVEPIIYYTIIFRAIIIISAVSFERAISFTLLPVFYKRRTVDIRRNKFFRRQRKLVSRSGGEYLSSKRAVSFW